MVSTASENMKEAFAVLEKYVILWFDQKSSENEEKAKCSNTMSLFVEFIALHAMGRSKVVETWLKILEFCEKLKSRNPVANRFPHSHRRLHTRCDWSER